MSFTVREKISESATTSVYRAYHETLAREVLLKVLHRQIANDEQARARFVREAHACAALRSEHIVQVYDLRDHDGAPAIVMEFVDGPSLKDVIAGGTQRTFAFTEKVAVHVLRGLAAAHGRGILHRDIKPGNILVSPEGVIKIADFGLAQISVAPTLTAEGVVVGTPAYLAPEVVRGEQVDARADLFALGATLVETLTGERLFEGDTYADCLNRIALFRTGMLDRLTPQSSVEFVEFLKRMMDPDPRRRYASAEEALDALKTTGSGRRLQLSPPRRRGNARRWAAIGITLAVIAGGAYILTRPADGVRPVSPGAVDSAKADVPPAQSSGDTSDPLRQRPVAPGSPAARSVTQLPDSGALVLVGDAGTKVSVDDRSAGELPLDSPVRVPAGVHAVLFSRMPFDPIVRTVRVNREERITVTADFLASAGYLKCTAVPWAEISVDDVYRDTTPMDRPLVVTSGTRRVRFHHPSFRDSVRQVVVAPKETVSVSMDFTR